MLLQQVDLQVVAKFFYLKYLCKNKDIGKSATFKGLVDIPDVAIEGPTQNVVARLCNAQAVKKAVQDGHDDVLLAADILLPKLARKERGRMERVRNRKDEPEVVFSADEDEAEIVPLPTRTSIQEKSLATLAWEVDETGGGDATKLAQPAQAPDRGPVKPAQALFRQPKTVVAAVSTSEDESDTTSDSEQEEDTKPSKRSRATKSVSKAESDATSDSTADSDQEGDTRPSKRSRPTTSTILPSLTSGFVSGSEDSDIEDVDEEPRKNRPGQRARQAIWEKKYGNKAKHLQKQSKNRDQGWDAKRGATSVDHYHKHTRSDNTGRSNGDAPRPAKKPKRDDSGPLHPSWEAAKLAKSKDMSIPAFSGKKISFD